MSENPEEQMLDMNIRGAIVKVQPHVVNDLILKELAVQLLEELEEVEGDKKLEEIPKQIIRHIDNVLRPYLSSRLGGQIIHPLFSDTIIMDRIQQFSKIVMGVVKDRISELMDEIESGMLNPEELRRRIRKIEIMMSNAFLVIREVANRMFVLVQINAPINARPPLVNSLEGIELIGSGGEME